MFDMADHDSEVGGGIMAGALAYRLFIWILPLTFVAIAGLGIASDAASRSPESAARSMGLAGLVSNSVASAANSSARWYALLIGIPLLVYTTRSLLYAPQQTRDGTPIAMTLGWHVGDLNGNRFF